MVMKTYRREKLYRSFTRQVGRAPLVLIYYLVESSVDSAVFQTNDDFVGSCPKMTYGICIRKIDSEKLANQFSEEAIVKDISTERDTVELMLSAFSRNYVTPCCLSEVIEDWLGLENSADLDICSCAENRIGA